MAAAAAASVFFAVAADLPSAASLPLPETKSTGSKPTAVIEMPSARSSADTPRTFSPFAPLKPPAKLPPVTRRVKSPST